MSLPAEPPALGHEGRRLPSPTRRLTMSHTPSTLSTGAPASDAAPLLDAERLIVYGVALEFQLLASVLSLRADAIMRDQLRRARLSIVLDIAEGAGQRSRPQKRHLSIARGSAMESAAILDVLRGHGVASRVEWRQARALVVRIVQMLTKLDQALS
ncbi:MAG TPA: four helix bundle protein [Vicinamibacteria bacterium]|nr:four helix bundle protein [Vicinamibacteria bacterium]